MKPIPFILFLLFLSCSVVGQRVSKTLIIDTLEGETTGFGVYVQSSHGTIFDANAGGPLNFAPKSVVLDMFPNVVTEVYINNAVEKDTEAYVDFVFDSGGRVTIRNFFRHRSDTIRINKVVVLESCIPDTIRQSISWYRSDPAAIDTTQQLKVLSNEVKIKTIEKKCRYVYPDPVTFVISGRKYFVPLTLETNMDVSNFCCGHKNMNKRKERKYEKDKEKGKPYTYFCGSTIRISSYWTTEVTIE